MTGCGIWIRKKRQGDGNPTKAQKKYIHIQYGTERGKSQMNHDPFGQIGCDRYLEPPDTGDFRYTKESLFDFPHEELYTIHLPVRAEENISVDFTGYCECDKCRKDKENAVALYRGMTVAELDGRVIYIDHLEDYLLERMSVVGR